MTKHQCLDHGEVAFCDGCLVDSLHHEISQLKAQLNNMEACYIEKKKECEGLRGQIDEALQEVKGLERFTGEDCIADFDVLQGAVSHACKRLEKTLRGES